MQRGVAWVGEYCLQTSRCSVHKPFVSNQKFTCISGEEFWRNGEIVFPTDGGRDTTYRTRFGYGVSHNGIIYANSNENQKLAMRRLTACREPPVSGASAFLYRSWHNGLKENQRAAIREMKPWFRENNSRYLLAMTAYKGNYEEMREHKSDPHPKRALREEGAEEVETWNLTKNKVWTKSVLYKMKKDELAKAGKYPRMIGDMGVVASLQGFRVTEVLKEAMASEPHYFGMLETQFVKRPSQKLLREVMNKLISPPEGGYFAYFSDDSCLSVIAKGGKVKRYNVDIKTCDGSHTGELFHAVKELTPGSEDEIDPLIKQCQLPIRVVDQENPANVVVLDPDEPTLYSGSTMTTFVNNMGEFVIAFQLGKVDWSQVPPERVEFEVMSAAKRAGYVVSCEDCEKVEDIQFLKHSPVLDRYSTYQPVLNLGVLFRASGTCRRELPKGDPVKTAATFQASLLQGMFPLLDAPIVRKMKVKAGKWDEKTLEMIKNEWHYKVDAEGEVIYVDDDALFRRYDLTEEESASVIELAGVGYGEFISGPAFDKILDKDYSLKTNYI